MITLRTLKREEKPENIITEILKAFEENPQEDVVEFQKEQFANTEEDSFSFRITRHECSIYKQIEAPALKTIYFNCLTMKQVSMHYSQPEIAAMAYEAMYQSVKDFAVKEYLAKLVGNCHTF